MMSREIRIESGSKHYRLCQSKFVPFNSSLKGHLFSRPSLSQADLNLCDQRGRCVGCYASENLNW